MTEAKKQSNKQISFYLWIVFVICLLCHPAIAAAIKETLVMCYTTIIPSLFPFLLLSDIFQNIYVPKRTLLSAIYARIYSTSEESFYPFIMGAICGFPVGAKEVCNLYKNRVISKNQAHHLLGFVNLASPAFVIISVGKGMRNSYIEGILLYAIQVFASFLVAKITVPKKSNQPNKSDSLTIHANVFSFSQTISNSTLSILSVCGMICTFSAIASIISSILPPNFSVFPIFILEIINGIKTISKVFRHIPLLSFSLTALAICFGGFSVHMQANLFISNTDLSFICYLKRKILCSILGFIFSVFLGCIIYH